jgi:hypothetical protein
MKKKILIVEDAQALLNILQLLLRESAGQEWKVGLGDGGKRTSGPHSDGHIHARDGRP